MTDDTIRLRRTAERLGYMPHPTLPDLWTHDEHPSTYIGWGLVARDCYQHMAQCTEDEYGEEHDWMGATEPGSVCACGDAVLVDQPYSDDVRWAPAR